jgi:hypothetical protein
VHVHQAVAVVQTWTTHHSKQAKIASTFHGTEHNRGPTQKSMRERQACHVSVGPDSTTSAAAPAQQATEKTQKHFQRSNTLKQQDPPEEPMRPSPESSDMTW